VIELLDAGIDVFTTLNVQHVESRADAVRQITGVRCMKQCPIRSSNSPMKIEIVDLTPEGLRERLAEGKVYMGDRAAEAAENFFQGHTPHGAPRTGAAFCRWRCGQAAA